MFTDEYSSLLVTSHNSSFRRRKALSTPFERFTMQTSIQQAFWKQHSSSHSLNRQLHSAQEMRGMRSLPNEAASFAKQSRAHPLNNTPLPTEHQRCEGQLLTTSAPQPPWVSTDLSLLLISEGSIDHREQCSSFPPWTTRRRFIGQGNIFDCSIFAVVLRHTFIRNIRERLFPPAQNLWPSGYAFQNTSRLTQSPQWRTIVPEQSYHGAAVKVLLEGHSYPSFRHVWVTHHSHQQQQWSKASSGVTGCWSATSWTWTRCRGGSAEHVLLHPEEQVNNLNTEEELKSSLSPTGALVMQRSRNARPEVVDWILQQHHAPKGWWPAAGHRQVTANHVQGAELLLIRSNMNLLLLQGQS